MNNYEKVTENIYRELISICGEKFVIYRDPEKLEPFSHDEVTDKSYHHMPEAVVRPAGAQEIAAIMKLANKYKIPVTPRGGGSGLSLGAVPVFGGIVIFLDRMNRILEIDSKNMVITVEPGVITNEINEAASGIGLFFAGYPMSLQSCFIGGNVAENAGGGKAVKYGVTGRYILGMEFVTPEGEITCLGGKIVKNVTGYDLINLMTGSEGTLGIITKIYTKLMPKPTEITDLLVLFKNAEDAINMVPLIITESKIIPAAIEFIDRLSAHTSCRYLNEDIPYEKAGAMLLIEVDGTDKQKLEDDYEKIGSLCMKNGAIEVYVADNFTTQERIWNVRRNIAEAFMVISPEQSLEDITVPVAEIPKIIPELERLSAKYNIQIPCYGHAGDGNLHVTPVKNPAQTHEEWKNILPSVLEELYIETGKLGGVISGEHGIGYKRKKYLKYSLDDTAIDLMKRIKKSFDPNNILNPGKIFDL
ncbi:MAG TPA: FAD-binding oxidoreductase [Spirochaetia bacterium]|nr:FAD-binding oxidoreductase [Spirochaetia bacterium]